MKCPQCLFENDQDARFCIDCGSPLKSEQAQKIVCPKCQYDNDTDSSFCIDCGASLKPIPVAPAIAPAKIAAPKPAAIKAMPEAQPEPEVLRPPVKEPPAKALPTQILEASKTIKVEMASEAAPRDRKTVEPPTAAEEPAALSPEFPFIEKTGKHSKPRKWLVPAGLVAALAVAFLAVWYFALRPRPSARPTAQLSMPAETAPQAASAPEPGTIPQSIPPAEIQAQPPAEKESAGEAVPLMAIPSSPAERKPPAESAAPPAKEAPPKTEAPSRLAEAENKKKEAAEIASLLSAAEAAYQAGNFEQCLEQVKKVIALDPTQPEALRYEEMAHQKLAPQNVKSLVDQFAAAANAGRLLSFYEAACQPALFQKIKRDVQLLEGQYGRFQSQCSQTTIRFLENGQIEARFSNITTGQLVSDNRRMIVFEGSYVWTLERQGERWLIAGLQSLPIRKQKS